ncbi:uncharacterized protein LOC126831663 isoform X3 [Patella vulgata]|uniref:uncharacterized protein LOC126831663 isoform X3 n=1 Tax=Patella vulgata TaxID=6465 RepID=UPI00217FF381|nr:uncharacterized protein LOC126831663 isoform X3 [Patella vulgata]
MINIWLFLLNYLLVLVVGTPHIETNPPILVEGNSAAITCITQVGVVNTLSYNGGPLPDCTSGTAGCDLYIASKTHNSLTVNITSVSRQRDAGTWICNGSDFSITQNIKVVARGEFLISAESPRFAIFKTDMRTRIHSILNMILGGAPGALSYDPTTNQIYWGDNRNDIIRTADTEGNMAEVVTGTAGTSTTSTIDGMAVDYINRLLYYTDTGPDTINVLSLDNYDYRLTLIDTGLDEPRGIALLPNRGQMYWTDWGRHAKIEVADMDGSNRRIFLSLENGTWPNGLTIDSQRNVLYWVNAKSDTIESVNLNGSNREMLLQRNRTHYFAIVLMGDYLYFNDWSSPYMKRMKKTGGPREYFGSPLLIRSLGLYAFNSSEIEQGTSVCKNSKCQQLCLPKQNSMFSCNCKNGFILRNNNCVEDKSKNTLKTSENPLFVIKGRDLDIVCDFNISSKMPTSGYTWTKKGKVVTGQTGKVFSIKSIQMSDNGTYTCSARTDTGTRNNSANINVVYPPIVSLPSSIKVIERETLSILCNATANPSVLDFKWSGPSDLDLSRYYYQLASNSTLIVPYVRRTMSGEYTCIVANTIVVSTALVKPITTRKYNKTYVDVLYGPTASISQKTIALGEKSNLKIDCPVDSNPAPSTYQWYDIAGKKINSSTKELMINGVTNGATFTCVATIRLEPTSGQTRIITHNVTVTVIPKKGVATIRLEPTSGQTRIITHNVTVTVIPKKGVTTIRLEPTTGQTRIITHNVTVTDIPKKVTYTGTIIAVVITLIIIIIIGVIVIVLRYRRGVFRGVTIPFRRFGKNTDNSPFANAEERNTKNEAENRTEDPYINLGQPSEPSHI